MEKLQKPRLRVIGIDPELHLHSIDAITHDIKSRNSMPDNAEVKVVHCYKNKDNKPQSLILEVNSETYRYIMRDKKIYIGAARSTVFNDFNINIHRNCSGFNHSYKKCCNDKIKSPCCTYCAGNHTGKNCQNKQNVC